MFLVTQYLQRCSGTPPCRPRLAACCPLPPFHVNHCTPRPANVERGRYQAGGRGRDFLLPPSVWWPCTGPPSDGYTHLLLAMILYDHGIGTGHGTSTESIMGSLAPSIGGWFEP